MAAKKIHGSRESSFNFFKFPHTCMQVCKGLGWKPEKEEPFVTLPLVLQARGQPPEWFDIADLNLEVDITHPT